MHFALLWSIHVFLFFTFFFLAFLCSSSQFKNHLPLFSCCSIFETCFPLCCLYLCFSFLFWAQQLSHISSFLAKPLLSSFRLETMLSPRSLLSSVPPSFFFFFCHLSHSFILFFHFAFSWTSPTFFDSPPDQFSLPSPPSPHFQSLSPHSLFSLIILLNFNRAPN